MWWKQWTRPLLGWLRRWYPSYPGQVDEGHNMWYIRGAMRTATLVSPVLPYRGFRGIDDFGGGGFGAPRRAACPTCLKNGRESNCRECEGRGFIVYTHPGLDVVGVEGDKTVAPHQAIVTHIGIAKADAKLGSIHMLGDLFRSRLLYGSICEDLKVDASIEAGAPIGLVQNVAKYYETRRLGKRMINHVHLDLWIKENGRWVQTDPALHIPSAPDGTE